MRPYMTLNYKETRMKTWRELSTLWKVWGLRVPFPRDGKKVSTPLGEGLVVEVTATADADTIDKPMFKVDYFDVLSTNPENLFKS